jgi:sodium/proline symporter
MDVQTWSWVFLAVYVGGMLGLGLMGMRRVKDGDDFATARGAYGPLFLAFALTATTASGATFVGFPGLAYALGFPGLWALVLYPLAVYIGIVLAMKVIARAGEQFGNRSIPEYLGDRYQSPFMRIGIAVLSLLLLFYLAAQLVSGLVMFHELLGLEPIWALLFTVCVLIAYIMLGGSHADILTDGVQGALMLFLSLGIAVWFVLGFGVEGGFSGMMDKLEALDPNLVKALPTTVFEGSRTAAIWSLIAIFIAHLPLGMLPHIGNKLWAVRGGATGRRRLVTYSFVFGLLLPLIALGGLGARALLGNELFLPGSSPDAAIPRLFMTGLPAWFAALLGVGVLSAVMSTADGLVVSTSQVFANDLYRRTFAPKMKVSALQAEAVALEISRYATLAILVAAFALAWLLQGENVALAAWIGIGGLMAAIIGPLLVGAFWRRATRAGAIASTIVGTVLYVVLKIGWDCDIVAPTSAMEHVLFWLSKHNQPLYAFSTSALAEIVAVVVMVAVSLGTRPPDEEHLRRVFGK